MRLTAASLTLFLAACGGVPVDASHPSTMAALRAMPGYSGKYVIEIGSNQDGHLQLDVRNVLEPSLFNRPSKFPAVIVVYPDKSTQKVDRNGEFDAAASTYAAHHPSNLSAPNVTIEIESLVEAPIAFGPTAFAIYVPSPKDEALESVSVDEPQFEGRRAPASVCGQGKALNANDTAIFTFNPYTTPLSPRETYPPPTIDFCTSRGPFGRVVDKLVIAEPNKGQRFSFRYQAPSALALKQAGVIRSKEFLSLTGLYGDFTSPIYTAACGTAC